MKICTFIFFFCAVLLGKDIIAMHQQSVRSIGPSQIQSIPKKAESELEKVLGFYLTETESSGKLSITTNLPEKLFLVYEPLAALAKESGAKLSHKDEIGKLVDLYFTRGTAAQKEVVTTMLYEDLLAGALERCECDDAPLKKRIELILDMKSRMKSRDENEPIVFTSILSGQVLQEFWTVRELQADGFKNITVNLINSDLSPEFAHHEPDEEEYYYLMNGIEEFSKRTGLAINQFDLTKKIVAGHINIFSNAYDYYIRAHLESPEFKSSFMTIVDPMNLQDAGKTEIPTVLAIYSEEQNEDEHDHNSSADILISFTNKERSRAYMQPIASEKIIELLSKISDFMKFEIDPLTLKKKLEEQFPGIGIVGKSTPLSIFREMIPLALADRGIAYILADQSEPITHHEVKIITKDHFNPEAYTTEVEAAEETYVHSEGYIDVF